MSKETLMTYKTDAGREIESIRAWEPGDGVSCSRARMAPRESPCGPPVAVYWTPGWETGRVRPDRPVSAPRKYVVCKNHLPVGVTPGEVASAARKAATEEVLVAHWGEYQAAIDRYVTEAMDQRLAGLPDDVREVILNAS